MKKELVVFKDPKSPVSEVFRTLRTNIQFMNRNQDARTILITSTSASEGKSWISSNLAVAFAQTGKKVLLIDADMRKGRQYSIFGISPKPGLSNYLTGVDLSGKSIDLENVNNYIQKTDIENLYVIASGNIPPNPAELLILPQMNELLEKVKKLCDVIIIDGTPCQFVADSLILTKIVDSTVLVVACKETKKEELKKVVTNIKNIGGKIAGVVVNKIPISAKKYESRYYYYGKKKDGQGENSERKFRESDFFNSKVEEEKKEDKSNNSDKSNGKYNNSSNVNLKDIHSMYEERTKDVLEQINEYLDKQEIK